MQQSVILGSGGHAKVIIEIMREAGIYEPIGCVSQPGPTASVLGVPIIGSDECLTEVLRYGVRCAFVALGDNVLRQRLLRLVRQLGFDVASAISPRANICTSVRLGSGVAIMPGANIGPDSTLADGVIINSNATVDHDATLGECCHVGPGAAIAGCVQIGELAFVATGCSVIPNVTIGRGCLVGAGSVVVRDVPEQTVAFGCPARVQRTLNSNSVPQNVAQESTVSPVSAAAFRLVI